MEFQVIHIFSYGEAQIICKGVNLKTKFSNLKKLQAVIDDIKSKRPSIIDEGNYHVINIFADLRVDYNSSKISSYKFDFKDLDVTKLNALVTEFTSLKKVSDKAVKSKLNE